MGTGKIGDFACPRDVCFELTGNLAKLSETLAKFGTFAKLFSVLTPASDLDGGRGWW
jgi:hypothetical protein